MNKTGIGAVAIIAAAVMLSSCTSYKDIVYFQDIDDVKLSKLTSEYEAVIKKDDRLTIVVSGPDKTVTAPYNLTLTEMVAGGTGTDPEQSTLSYLVDVNGDIEFPILGKIHVEGMTRSELVDYLTDEIGKDVQNPIVYISFRNYKITVLGEVRNPGTFTFDSEKISILQALGRAGDLDLTAERKDILLLREVDGVQTHHKVDLKDSHLLDSPYFYLQQNDVIVVQPSPTRVKTATTATGIWGVVLSSITTTLAVISMIITASK
ncbi:MAG: polysaccharide biosynthesis/export family protein [Bacteroidaceae bacterium]|nr:polysaccharide biosynthesis/export family protein [Bacteroidaceae bacterium]